VVTVVLLRLIEMLIPECPNWLRYAAGMGISMTLGLGLEIMQSFDPTRDAEWIDLFNDGVGTLSFACLYASRDARLRDVRVVPSRGWLLGLGALGVLLGWLPFGLVCAEYETRHRLFPVIIDFAEPCYRSLCRSQANTWRAAAPPSGWPADAPDSQVVAKIAGGSPDGDGFVFREPYPDWQGYQRLEFSVYLDDSRPCDFSLRVEDQRYRKSEEDRFSQVVHVQPGYQQLAFSLHAIRNGPQDRELQMDQVAVLKFSPVDDERSVTYYLGTMRLVK
jgi:hypothetical protein